MQVWLVGRNPELVSAWEREFEGFVGVHVVEGNILQLAENTIVSPANSYGIMDGGIDLVYTEYFGPRLQEEVQRAVGRRPEGYLPVGAAVLVKTGHQRIPYMISAPTRLMIMMNLSIIR